MKWKKWYMVDSTCKKKKKILACLCVLIPPLHLLLSESHEQAFKNTVYPLSKLAWATLGDLVS